MVCRQIVRLPQLNGTRARRSLASGSRARAHDPAHGCGGRTGHWSHVSLRWHAARPAPIMRARWGLRSVMGKTHVASSALGQGGYLLQPYARPGAALSGAEPLWMLRQRDNAAGECQHADRPEQERSVTFVGHRQQRCNRHAKRHAKAVRRQSERPGARLCGAMLPASRKATLINFSLTSRVSSGVLVR
jgi:hypothetical protein